ncbi:MAG: class I SAM-dependent methyltransferase [Nitrococcus sp.]|nr:class I SAM-dependent methyltransferase [Nitrococcus sp.]
MKAIQNWFCTPLGCSLVEAECRLLSQRMACLYARHVLQVGAFARGQRPALFRGARQWVLDDWPEAPVDVAASPVELPLHNETMDIVILIHQLEFSDYPHQILREAERVLSPEGHMLVLGFNPVSVWGLRYLFASRRRGGPPSNGRYRSQARIEDWMRLLGLEIERKDRLHFSPPLNNRGLFGRLRRREEVAPSFLRWVGGVHLTIGQKRVGGRIPAQPVRRPRLAVIPGALGQPSSRSRVNGTC